MKSLLTITAVIEGLTGLALAVVPSLIASGLLGISLTDSGAIIIARLAGIALITIATACWFSRNDAHSFTMVKAMLVYNALTALLLMHTTLFEKISGPGLWPAVLLHLGLLAWCISCLSKRAKQ